MPRLFFLEHFTDSTDGHSRLGDSSIRPVHARHIPITIITSTKDGSGGECGLDRREHVEPIDPDLPIDQLTAGHLGTPAARKLVIAAGAATDRHTLSRIQIIPVPDQLDG